MLMYVVAGPTYVGAKVPARSSALDDAVADAVPATVGEVGEVQPLETAAAGAGGACTVGAVGAGGACSVGAAGAGGACTVGAAGAGGCIGGCGVAPHRLDVAAALRTFTACPVWIMVS